MLDIPERRFGRVLKYEFLNLIRNRWILFFSILSPALSFSLIQISGDFKKSLVTLSTLSVVIIPLLSVLFASVSWYYTERFTQLLLTQPLPRKKVFAARIIALLSSLALSLPLSGALPFLLFGYFSSDLLLWAGVGVFLSSVFIFLGVLICLCIQDKIQGIGTCIALWIYFAILHDALGLLFLILLKDFPMDFPSAIVGTLNPIGLARVTLLVHQDSALLLGHSGALVREFLTGWGGKLSALGCSLIWLAWPAAWSYRKFLRSDF